MTGHRGVWLVVAGLVFALGCGESKSDPSAETGGTGNTPATAGRAGSSSDAGGSDSNGGEGGSAGSAAGQPGTDCDCDDGVACTFDDCSSGKCQHVIQHFACPTGQFCAADKGCTAGEACATEADCVRPDSCVTASCDAATKRCLFAFLDGDHDGVTPVSCGGTDCNDADPALHGGAVEVCDGKDNDCDGDEDPPKASGCAADRSCISGNCLCDAPNTACSVGCVDTQVDSSNCGYCGNACGELEQCVKGECACTAGLTRCNNECVDLESDLNNCGKCSNHCGNGNSECKAGACACPAETTNCSNDEILYCLDLQSDPYACGDCSTRCLSGGVCGAGKCDTTLEWVKLYGGYAGSHQYYRLAPMDVDANGNVFVGYSGEGGTITAQPGGQATLWSSRNVITKFDATGAFEWAKTSDVGFNDVAVVGSDVWTVSFIAYNTPKVTIAGQAFTLPDGYEAMTVLVKLSGANGAVLDHFQLDHSKWNTANEPFMVHDDAKLWVVGSTYDLHRDDTTWTRPSTAYGSYVYPPGGTPLWLPGRVYYGVLNAAGKLELTTSLPGDSSFTFGGQTFDTDSYGGQGFARYSKELVHELSYVNAQTTRLVSGADVPTFVDGYTNQLFTQVDDTGAATKVEGGNQLPLHISNAKAKDGRILLSGNGGGSTPLFGRKLSGPLLTLAFDESTLALSHAFVLGAEFYSGYGYGRIDDFAFVDGGNAIVLSVLFDGGVNIGAENIDLGSGYQGLALIKVKLN